jgi:hypothetical protein
MKRRSLVIGPAALVASGGLSAQAAGASTATAAPGSSGSPEATYPAFDLRRYGADSTGAVASDAAMANALLACGSTGGRIRLPAGSYSFAHPIDLSGRRSVSLEGDAAATGGGQSATRLVYTGSGDGVFINMNSAVGCQLRGLQITHADPRYTGTYVKCSNGGSNDPAFCALFDCVLGSSAGAGTVHLDLDKCIEFTAERCNFICGNPSVRGRSAGGYSNVIRFRDCQWASNHAVPVQNGGQCWTFEGCTFEGLLSGAAGALCCAEPTAAFNGLVVVGCWFGDVTAAGTWIDICGNGVLIGGNYISGNAHGPTGVILRKSAGVQIAGNLWDQLLVGIHFAVGACQDIVVQGNIASLVGTGFRGAENVPSGSLVWGPNYGFGEPGTTHRRLTTTGYVADAAAGLVRQWGSVPVPGGAGTHRIEFPLKFPNECFNVVASLASGTTAGTVCVAALTPSGFEANVQGASGSATLSWQALGH